MARPGFARRARRRTGRRAGRDRSPASTRSRAHSGAAAVGRWAERGEPARRGRQGGPVRADHGAAVSARAFERLGGFDVAFTRGGLVPEPTATSATGEERRVARRLQSAAISYSTTRSTRRLHAAVARTAPAATGSSPRYRDRGELWRPRSTRTGAARARAAEVFPVRQRAAQVTSRALVLPADPAVEHRFFFAVQTMERCAARAKERRMQARWRRARLSLYRAWRRPDPRRVRVPPTVRGAAHGLPLRLALVGLDVLDALSGSDASRSVRCSSPSTTRTSICSLPCRSLEREWPPSSSRSASGSAAQDCGAARRQSCSCRCRWLRQVSAHGVAIGSHGATHTPLSASRGRSTGADGLGGRIASLGLPRPAVFSYPTGSRAERRGGCSARWLSRCVHRHSRRRAPVHDRYTFARIEVLERHVRTLAAKLRRASR